MAFYRVIYKGNLEDLIPGRGTSRPLHPGPSFSLPQYAFLPSHLPWASLRLLLNSFCPDSPIVLRNPDISLVTFLLPPSWCPQNSLPQTSLMEGIHGTVDVGPGDRQSSWQIPFLVHKGAWTQGKSQKLGGTEPGFQSVSRLKPPFPHNCFFLLRLRRNNKDGAGDDLTVPCFTSLILQRGKWSRSGLRS